MRKNVAGQVVGAQLVSAVNGTEFTGEVTCWISGDGGAQAQGNVGSGACTHVGKGFHIYFPSQAETNFNHIAFTFTGVGAIPVTVQIYTLPATDLETLLSPVPSVAQVTAKLDTMLEADGDNHRLTGASLANVPAAEVELTPEDIESLAEQVAGQIEIPTAQEVADTVLNASSDDYLLPGSIGEKIASGGSGQFGDGEVEVDHDYGGEDNLRYTLDGVGVDNATILAYLTSDYDAGNRGQAYIQGATRTTVDGRWHRSLMLDPANYTLVFYKQGVVGPDVVKITVS